MQSIWQVVVLPKRLLPTSFKEAPKGDASRKVAISGFSNIWHRYTEPRFGRCTAAQQFLPGLQHNLQ
jgi:hypothetical protein